MSRLCWQIFRILAALLRARYLLEPTMFKRLLKSVGFLFEASTASAVSAAQTAIGRASLAFA